MSLPLKAIGATVTIEIGAGVAAVLAREINWLLSRIKDEQDKDPQCMIHVEQGTQLWHYLNHAASIGVCDNAKLCVVPDRPTRGCSGYMNYSEPFHYIEPSKPHDGG